MAQLETPHGGPRQLDNISRPLRRDLSKKIGRTYKDDLTRLGRSTIACALRLREETVVPALANG